MMTTAYPILEYDPTPLAMIEPSQVLNRIELPEHCVLCFFSDVIAEVCAEAKVVFETVSEIGINPIYLLDVPSSDNQTVQIAVLHPGVAAPLSAAFLEEVIALGCTKFIACGGAGVLNKALALGHLVIPSSAVRDEGTSYHYLPPAREVSASAEGIAAIEATLQRYEVPYVIGKTWTTDAIYRETPNKVAQRKAEGCITVEMEAAAFFAVAQFRGVTFAQILYGGDDLSGDEWDHRNWHRQASIREKLFWLAAEAVTRL